jgi:hypothetical protein
LDTTPQTPSSSAVARNPTKAQSDKSTQNQDRKWHVKLGPVLVSASYSRFGDPFYYPYGLSPFDGFHRAWLWDPYWAYPVSYPSGYFGYDGERGEIKLTPEPRTVDPKLAEVCVNNGFGRYGRPVEQYVSILSKGRTVFRRRIYVLSGRSLKIAARLDSVNPGEATESKP